MARLKSRILSALKVAVQLGFLSMIFALIWGFHSFARPFAAPVGTPGSVILMLEEGATLSVIANSLSRNGIISDASLFIWGARIYGLGTSLKAGEYEFAEPTSMRAVLKKLSLGQVMEHRLTIPEGISSTAALEIINADERLSGETVMALSEGALLPETYLIRRGDIRQSVIDRMQAAQAEFLAREWALNTETRPLPTMHEVVILASIVERETAVGEERAHIAGVFLNRLRLGMKLQSDPTVRYALVLAGKMAMDSNRPLLQSELSFAHGYNTYVHAGLPPGPIANPGAAAVRAVLSPLPTRDLYFVADGNGGHAFAETLAEHETNVRHWRSIEHVRQ